ncbi:LysR family transcriptional regulator [Sulfitobacter sp. 20_GPM-1509m]|uniref:LysR family transcriptional regulator n=1 Tax=Sulfitobacter sp. 20_GPM-1509m TaxID=1380367 RepID=UPI0034A0B343
MEDAVNWNDTPAFLAVARTGTLTGAAASLGAGVATVSRRIERLVGGGAGCAVVRAGTDRIPVDR